jgi:S-adenosylmethionine decarboxylase proenzyme
MDSSSSTTINARPPFLGRQLHLDLEGCPFALLDDLHAVQAALRACADAIGATVVESVFHKFGPQGVSGVVVIMESHIAIHTWPEYGYAAVDIFTCGTMDMEPGVAVVVAALGAGSWRSAVVERGRISG